MKVLKFGGTSVGSPENMRAVINIITDGEQKLVVLSAMSGTTNSLVDISNYLYKKNKDAARMEINKLEQKYNKVISDLFTKESSKNEGAQAIAECFDTIRSFTSGEFTKTGEHTIVAQGELMSTALFTILMRESGYKTTYLPALDFMRIDADKAADQYYINKAIKEVLAKAEKADYYITQGFICRNAEGEIDNLQRGGSDYTASLIGAAINAEEIEIWTDIDGFHNNDPRYVERTRKIDQLSFYEAAELAYFGAKILHPQTVLPAKLHNIPVRLKNTMNPSDSGTLIAAESSGNGIKAIAAKDGIIAIKVRSYRMLMAYGFLKNIFEIFEFFKTPIDMISTSEVAVSITIDDTTNLESIILELKEYGEVEVDYDQTIICVVGDMIAEEKGFAAKVFDALEDIPIRMISYGGSRHNISLLVQTSLKKQALTELNEKLLHN